MPRSFIVLSGNQELELTAAALYGKATNPGDTAITTLGTSGALRVGQDAAPGTLLDGTSNSSWIPTVPGSGILYFPADQFTFNGSAWDRQRTPVAFKTIQNVAVVAGSPVTIWTPAASKKFRLMGWVLSLSVAGRILLLDNAAGAELVRTGGQAAGIAEPSPPRMGNGLLSAAANNVLKADVSASGNINGFVFGTEE